MSRVHNVGPASPRRRVNDPAESRTRRPATSDTDRCNAADTTGSTWGSLPNVQFKSCTDTRLKPKRPPRGFFFSFFVDAFVGHNDFIISKTDALKICDNMTMPDCMNAAYFFFQRSTCGSQWLNVAVCMYFDEILHNQMALSLEGSG